jgi:hypothetical protein
VSPSPQPQCPHTCRQLRASRFRCAGAAAHALAPRGALLCKALLHRICLNP